MTPGRESTSISCTHPEKLPGQPTAFPTQMPPAAATLSIEPVGKPPLQTLESSHYYDESCYTEALVTFYIHGFSVRSLGLVSNVLSLIVINSKAMRYSTYSYLSPDLARVVSSGYPPLLVLHLHHAAVQRNHHQVLLFICWMQGLICGRVWAFSHSPGAIFSHLPILLGEQDSQLPNNQLSLQHRVLLRLWQTLVQAHVCKPFCFCRLSYQYLQRHYRA